MLRKALKSLLLASSLICLSVQSAWSEARDLDDVLEAGVLRHIGIPYANFVTGLEDGLDVELVQGFAEHLGVRYEFSLADWKTVFSRLYGYEMTVVNGELVWGDEVEVQGDLIANGMTILEWRKEFVDFSEPTFPSGVWWVARSDSDLKPIRPTGSIMGDINEVKTLMDKRDVLALKYTCLDPDLYDLDQTGANIILPTRKRKLNEMVPAILNQDAESTLLDIADTLIALQKWPGEIKVIGPVSEPQMMAVGFRKDAPNLRAAFNDYLHQIRMDGTYNEMVKRYYPAVFHYSKDFFQNYGKDVQS